MFYDSNLLSKEGPLATVWLAANLEKKLSKSQLLHTNISKTTKAIIESEDPERRKKSREAGEISSTTSGSETESLSLTQQTRRLVASQPIALRLSGQLLYGVVKIYSRKEKYLLDDVSNVLVKLKTIFRSSNLQTVILPANKTIANVNKLTLPDTITEANVIPQLLQQEPLVFDFDDGDRAGAAPPSPPASIGSDERNYERRADIGAGAVAGHTDFQLSFDYDQSIELGRNISRTEAPGIVGATEEDEDFVTGGDVIGVASRRGRRGQGPDHDDLDIIGGGNDPTQEHDDLMLDFGNDDFQQAPLSPPAQGGDLAEQQQQQQQQPQGPGDVSLQLDFGDQTVEQGRERRPSVTEHDLTFGVDTLFKEGETAGAAGGVEGEEQTRGALEGNIFSQGPLEAVPEQQGEIRDQQQREAEKARATREEATARTRTGGRKDRKRLHFDDEIEMSGTEFYRLQQVQTSEEISSIRAIDLKKQELREKLTNSRELFYLKKYSNPGYLFINSDSFKQLWDTKGVDAAAQREAKRRRLREGEAQEGDKGAVTQGGEEQSAEILPHDHHFIEPTDNDFNFDLGFDEQFAPEPEYETLEGGTSETKDTITNKDQSSESFLQKMTATELVSSMTGSIRDEVGSQLEGEDVEDKDNDDIASRTSRTDFESFSQAESQTEELGGAAAAAAAGGAASSISKSTLKIASVLRDEFIGKKDASIDLETVIYRDTHGEDLDQMPLSRQPKKEAVRCFFELLVLATGDAITLKQDKLFGNISVGCKDSLFERF